ncbi:hypothetical protein LDG_7853 [Legionella drancourtii LLAP12]|uniref:Uncharacterized protein n=1 Tax=Legionella drancourtii LLAP12 TaxID=658187 RepID=G9ERE1_9GAMM|nr:hypothetical protein LDG_7853 [Legionella drancourtii LLAP12]
MKHKKNQLFSIACKLTLKLAFFCSFYAMFLCGILPLENTNTVAL